MIHWIIASAIAAIVLATGGYLARREGLAKPDWSDPWNWVPLVACIVAIAAGFYRSLP